MSASKLVFELADGTFEVQVSYVLEFEHIESCLLGHRSDGACILIGRIADHQGNAFVSLAADNQQTTCRTGKTKT
jgi:hypothetical protein